MAKKKQSERISDLEERVEYMKRKFCHHNSVAVHVELVKHSGGGRYYVKGHHWQAKARCPLCGENLTSAPWPSGPAVRRRKGDLNATEGAVDLDLYCLGDDDVPPGGSDPKGS